MNVVPSVTSDRPESVLHDIAMARAAQSQTVPAMASGGAPPASDSRSLVAEREADELLAKGDQAAATKKFVEADRLSAVEATAAPAGVPRASSWAGRRPGGKTDLGD